jgi:hypothetical protein
VAIVVDPEFGFRLAELAVRMPVWVIDTPANRSATERIWAAATRPTAEGGVTIFRADLSEPPDERVVAILSDVELHHGEYSHDPPLNALEIHGVALTRTLRAALAEMGFSSTESGEVVLASAAPAA